MILSVASKVGTGMLLWLPQKSAPSKPRVTDFLIWGCHHVWGIRLTWIETFFYHSFLTGGVVLLFLKMNQPRTFLKATHISLIPLTSKVIEYLCIFPYLHKYFYGTLWMVLLLGAKKTIQLHKLTYRFVASKHRHTLKEETSLDMDHDKHLLFT